MYKILIFLLISFSSVYAVDYTLNPDYDCVKNDFDATCTCQLGSFTSNTYHYGTSYHFAGIGVNYEIGRECSVSPVNITQIYDDGTGYRDGYYSYSSVLKECKNGSVISADGTTCECPSDMTKVVNDGVASCVCPSGTELVIAKKCPCDDGDTCEYPPQCMEPCPDGTQRNSGGGCCPIGKISYLIVIRLLNLGCVVVHTIRQKLTELVQFATVPIRMQILATVLIVRLIMKLWTVCAPMFLVLMKRLFIIL